MGRALNNESSAVMKEATEHSLTLLPGGGGIQSLSRVQLFMTPWSAAHQASLSFTVTGSLLRLMSIELVMPSKHLIFC